MEFKVLKVFWYDGFPEQNKEKLNVDRQKKKCCWPRHLNTHNDSYFYIYKSVIVSVLWFKKFQQYSQK